MPQPSSSIGPMTKPPRLTGNIARSVLMICGAFGNRVLGEQHRVEVAGAERLRQRRRAGGVLHADQAADAGQREAERQLDRRKLSEDQQQQREAGFRVRIEQADRLDVDRQHLQLEDARVALLVHREVAAALDDARVERQADAVRRLERELQSRPAAPPFSVERMPRRSTDAANGPSATPNEAETSISRFVKLPPAGFRPRLMSCSSNGPVGSVGTGRLTRRPGAVDEAQRPRLVGFRDDIECDGDAVAENHLRGSRRTAEWSPWRRAPRSGAAARRLSAAARHRVRRSKS